MKVLLTTLNSKYIHSNLALKYLYVAGMDQCPGLYLKEYTINNEDSYVFSELVQGAYNVICFSCYIWNIEKTRELAENLKMANPRLIIACGGPEVSYGTREFLSENPAVDVVMRGEGEFTFHAFCGALQEHKDRLLSVGNGGEIHKNRKLFLDSLSYIKGLSYRVDSEIFENPGGELLIFDSIPFPYRHFPCEEDKIHYYESARGCPYGCTYCISSLDRKVRALPLDRVKEELSYFLYSCVKQVKLIDRTFNWDRERCYQILKFLKDKDNGVTNFHFELCGDLIDRELLQLLSDVRPGLFQFEIGIQSTNPETLRAVNRNDRISLVLENVRQLVSLGTVHTHVDLIAGLPLENYFSFKKSFNDVYELGADTFQLGFLKLLKGTALRDTGSSYGYIYRKKPPYEVISNPFLSSNDIIKLKQIEVLLDLYYNRGGFGRTLDYLIRITAQSPFDFYEEFTEFYRLKGYGGLSHKKEDLYRILYKYALWKGRSSENLCSEVLYLLKEDMKEALNPEAVKRFERRGWEI